MTDHRAEMHRLAAKMRIWAKKNAETPELAGAALLRSGIITEDGELAPEYGGPKRRDK